ncbi:MAG: GMP/IMP nucleotidase [Gammaproteobacteria bacterium]|nr:GMP/IMP nucleotidase [Gammaproteobacteria bacterium]
MIDWQQIDTVFLDMDGTLLDLHFDNYFWLQHVPQRYAQSRSISLEQAKQELFSRYKDVEASLEWYCVDHWSRELGLDIVLLKQEVEHLISVHPHVVEFLDAMRRLQKKTLLVTNAHQKSLALKMDRTKLSGHLDGIICSHDLGYPKESDEFWERLQQLVPFDKRRTLFVDDSPSVLHAAQRYGLEWLLMVLRPDTKGPTKTTDQFPAIHDFSEIMP